MTLFLLLSGGESLNSHKLILNICHAEGTSLLPFFRDKVE
jgi:hypothetical protein